MANTKITAANIDSTSTGITLADLTVNGATIITKTGTNASPHIKLTESGDTREFNIYNDGSGNGRLVLADTDDTPDTEIVLADNGQILFNTANAEVGKFDSLGRFGIGCNPTGYATEIQATTGGNALKLRGRSAGGNEGWLAWTDNADNVEAAMYATANNLIFANTTSYTERMRIDSSGNVGIGETSPDKQLHIKDSGAVGIAIESTDNAQNLDIDFYNNVGSVQGRIRYSEGAGTFGFAPNVSASDALHIQYGGNVGINSTSPQTKFVVQHTDGQNGIEFSMGSSENYIQSYNRNTNDYSDLSIAGETLRFRTNDNTERMRIDSSGITTFYNDAQVVKTSAGGNGGAFLIRNASSSSGSYCRLYLSPTANDATSRGTIIQAENTDGNNNMAMVFKVSAGSDPAEHMRINPNGRISMGDTSISGYTSPTYAVNVFGSGYSLHIKSSTGYAHFGSNNTSYFHHDGNRSFYWDNACYANGGFHTYSDERLKENIELIPNALDKIELMRGVSFTWDNSEKTRGLEGKQFGVIAQDMLQVDPELPILNVDPQESQENIEDTDRDTDYYTMDYSRITPFLIEAIKELKTKLELAEARITELEG